LMISTAVPFRAATAGGGASWIRRVVAGEVIADRTEVPSRSGP
jgi:hypothetical protein